MDEFLKTKRLSLDWLNRNREAIIRESAERLQRTRLRVNLRRPWPQSTTPTLDDDTLSGPLSVHVAMRLFNTAAFCYWMVPGRTQFGQFHEEGLCVASTDWLPSMMWIWRRLCSAEAIADDRQALMPVEIIGQDALDLESWLGLGLRSDLDTEARFEAQAAGLDVLIARHRRLCDLVHARAYGLPGPFDQEQMGRSLPIERMGYYHATFIPTCRAVFLDAPCALLKDRGVLLVLTGDDEQLKSGPPSLDDIPAAEILCVRAKNAVEVSLDTAVRFVAGLEAAEEDANEDLRRVNADRRQYRGRVFHDEQFRTWDWAMECRDRGEDFEFVAAFGSSIAAVMKKLNSEVRTSDETATS